MKTRENEHINFQYEGRQTTLELEELKKTLILLRAISHPLRQDIIQLLDKKGPRSVTEVFIALRIEQSVASQQLGILQKANILTSKRTGKFVYYTLDKNRLQQLIQLVNDLTKE